MNEYLDLIARAESCIEDAREHPMAYGTELETELYAEADRLYAEAEKAAWIHGLDEFLPD
jgi:hypothetical protein